MSLKTELQRSKIARRLWHALPYRVRVEVWKTTHHATAAFRQSAPSRRQWAREAMNRDVETLIESLDPPRLNVVEVSGGIRSGYPWAFYTRLEYPDFDLADPTATHNGRYDLVICEQVLEHVRVWAPYRPWRSLRNDPNLPVVVWALAHIADGSEA